MIKTKLQLNFADFLFFIVMAFVLSFQSSSRIKAIPIIVFFAYMVLLKLISGGKVRNSLHFVWLISFFALGYLSKQWARVPSGASEQLNNVFWSILLSLSVAIYVIYYNLDVIQIAKRMLFVAVLFIFNVLINGTFVDGRLSVSINENIFGQTAISIACLLLYWCKKKNWQNWFLNVITALMAVISLLSGSRKSIIALAIYLILYLLFEHSPKNTFIFLRRILISVVICLVGYVCIMNIGFLYSSIGVRVESLAGFLYEGLEQDGSAVTRVNMIVLAKSMFLENPWIGVGLNNFKYLTIYGTYAHSNYYELAACLGIVGLTVYYLPLVIFLFKAVKLWFADIPQAIMPLSIILVFFINDIGSVSYFSVVSHIFTGLAIGLVYDNKNKLVSTDYQLN